MPDRYKYKMLFGNYSPFLLTKKKLPDCQRACFVLNRILISVVKLQQHSLTQKLISPNLFLSQHDERDDCNMKGKQIVLIAFLISSDGTQRTV